MSYAPFINTIKIYKGTTFGYQFNFEENGSNLDLTTLSDISVTLGKQGQTIFEHTVSDGDLTITGTDDHQLVGKASASTMNIGLRSYDLIVRFTFPNGDEEVYVDFQASIIKGENQTAHEWNIVIDTDAETVSGEQLTGLTALALQAKVDAENASTALLDGFHVERYNGSLSTIEFGPSLTVERYDGTVQVIEQS